MMTWRMVKNGGLVEEQKTRRRVRKPDNKAESVFQTADLSVQFRWFSDGLKKKVDFGSGEDSWMCGVFECASSWPIHYLYIQLYMYICLCPNLCVFLVQVGLKTKYNKCNESWPCIHYASRTPTEPLRLPLNLGSPWGEVADIGGGTAQVEREKNLGKSVFVGNLRGLGV